MLSAISTSPTTSLDVFVGVDGKYCPLLLLLLLLSIYLYHEH
jgi:hypothetical protein